MVKSRVVAAVVLAALGAGAIAWAAPRPARPMLPERRDRPIVYVALGDSTVEGEGATRREANYVSRLHQRLRALYPAATAVNLGIGGATSADVARDQPGSHLPYLSSRSSTVALAMPPPSHITWRP